MATRKSGLGRGLEALIPTQGAGSTTGYSNIPVDTIKANPDQPRSRFDDESLTELASSIEEVGVLQPIIVEEGEGGFTLIAGERRWRAAKRAGLASIPAVIREKSGQHTLVEALVENVQRMDLTPLEEARAYQQLLEEYGMTQEQVANRVGKSRPTISNTIRLLQLPNGVQALVEEGRLSGGHARALVGLEDAKYATYLGEKAAADGWSVRQIEDAVRLRRDMAEGNDAGPATVKTIRPIEIIELEKRLGDRLGARVKINYRNQKGKVEIRFSSVEELERLYRLMASG
ncbi:MAG: ParB/RepB/Spo0J family partition protein [Actinobacteria bacterium]|nr:MAG: ParB/RepB/Spo0J family partition protein [Actinomycetota bacterium]